MNSTSSQTSLIERLADEFAERQRRGERPTIEEYVHRFPDLASEIREVLPALGMMEQVAPAADDLEESKPPAEPPLREIGDYRILREIGRGGMGVVYEAEQQSLRRRVALKALPRELASCAHSMERFEREARAAARMHHTNIVPVFEVGQVDDTAFYAMQLIHGQGLDLVIADLKRMRNENSVDEVAAAGRQTRQAVQRIIRELRSEGSAQSGSQPRGSVKGAGAPSIAASLLSGDFQPMDLAAEAAEAAEMDSDSPDQVSLPAPPSEKEVDLPETVTAEEPVGSAGSATLPGESDISTAESDRYRYYRSVAQIGLQTASALSYAHARGIIHRDIKPSNLIVDAGGVVWVTDFGLAKMDDSEMTHTGDILGTMRYMSPERFQGKCDVRADVYSLGLTLYELLVLRPAFRSPDRLRLVEMIRDSEPPSPRSIDPRVPRDLETIVLKSIDKDPKGRYQSADELSDDLRRYIEDKPIQARRASLPERLVRWSRRNRGVAASLAAIGVLLLATAVGSSLAAMKFAEVSDQVAEAYYYSQLPLAARELDRGKYGNARSILLAVEPQFRNWEWGWLVSRAWPEPRVGLQPELKPLPLRPSGTNAAEYWSTAQEAHEITRLYDDNRVRTKVARFIPGSTKIVIAGVDGSLAVWDSQTGKRPTTLPQLGSIVLDLAVSHNGKMLAASDVGGGYYLLNMETDSQILRQPQVASEENRNGIRGFWFSPDDKWLVAACKDGTLSVVEISSEVKSDNMAQRMQSVQAEHPQMVTSIRFLEGGVVRSASQDGTVLAWELETGEQVGPRQGIEHEIDQIPSVVRFRPNTQEVAAAYRDGSVILWNWDTEERRDIRVHGDEQIKSLAFSRDGTCMFIAAGDRTVEVLDMRGNVLNRFTTPMSQYEGQMITVNAQGTRLATISHDGVTTIWAPATETGLRTLSRAHDDVVLNVDISSPNGDRIVTASYDGMARVWDLRSGELVREFEHAHELLKAEFSPDGKRVVTIDSRGTTRLWDVETGDELFSKTAHRNFYRTARQIGGLRGETANFCAVFSSSSFAGDGRLVVNTEDGMGVVDSEGEVLFELTDGPQFGWPVVSPNGERVAVLTNLYEVRLWDLETHEKLPPLVGHEMQATWAAFNRDGTLLVTGSMDDTAIAWNASTGERLVRLHHDNTIMAARFSPDGTRLATASADGTARVWDLHTGEMLAELEHGPRVNNIQFSPDGTRIITTCLDDIVRVWKPQGAHLVPLAEYTRDHELIYATWGPDGRRILTCWGDGAVHVLEAFPWEEGIDDRSEMKKQVERWRARRSGQ